MAETPPNKRRRRVRRVQTVKHDFLTLTDAIPLTRKGQQILKLLGAGNPASVVARAVGCCRSNVSYWKDKFLSVGAIRLQVRDVVHAYHLTRYGSKILTISEGCFTEVCVLEDHAVKFRALNLQLA